MFNALVSIWDDLALNAMKVADNLQESVQGEFDVE